MSEAKLTTGSLWILVVALTGAGCGPRNAQVGAATHLKSYVAEAGQDSGKGSSGEGSLYVHSGGRTDLFRDFKARDVNDIVTIRVVETTQANASADAKNSKNAQASAGFDALFGAEKRVKELPALVSGKSSSSFEGSGSTGRATTLQTTLSARVVEVLPNGFLVVEGVREIRLNNENQTVYLTGVVRPEDISPGNVVLSSAVAQMSVRVEGKGTVSQPLKPGWLYRILNGVLPF